MPWRSRRWRGSRVLRSRAWLSPCRTVRRRRRRQRSTPVNRRTRPRTVQTTSKWCLQTRVAVAPATNSIAALYCSECLVGTGMHCCDGLSNLCIGLSADRRSKDMKLLAFLKVNVTYSRAMLFLVAKGIRFVHKKWKIWVSSLVMLGSSTWRWRPVSDSLDSCD